MQCTNGKLQVTVEADHSSHKRNQHVEKPQENFVRERLLGLLQSNCRKLGYRSAVTLHQVRPQENQQVTAMSSPKHCKYVKTHVTIVEFALHIH